MPKVAAQYSLAAVEDDLLAKSTRSVFEEALDPRAHIGAVEQRGTNLVDNCVSRADATLQICSTIFLPAANARVAPLASRSANALASNSSFSSGRTRFTMFHRSNVAASYWSAV